MSNISAFGVLLYLLFPLLIISLSVFIFNTSEITAEGYFLAKEYSNYSFLYIVILAAISASFYQFLNSSTYHIMFDFYKNYKPKLSNCEFILKGRMTTFFMLLLAIIAVSLLQKLDVIIIFKIAELFSYFTVFISLIFLIAILSEKYNGIYFKISLPRKILFRGKIELLVIPYTVIIIAENILI